METDTEVDLSEKGGKDLEKGQGMLWEKPCMTTGPQPRAAKPKEESSVKSFFKILAGRDKSKEPKSMQLQETEDRRPESATTIPKLPREAPATATTEEDLHDERTVKQLRESEWKLGFENARLEERARKTDAALRRERERPRRAEELEGALRERPEERPPLQRKFEEAWEKLASETKERFEGMLAAMTAESREEEERNSEPAARNDRLQERRTESARSLSYLRKQLADTQLKLAAREESLQTSVRQRGLLRDGKAKTERYIDLLTRQLKEKEEEEAQSKLRVDSLQRSLEAQGREAAASSQKLLEALSASAEFERTIEALQESLRKLSLENARLEEQAKGTDVAVRDRPRASVRHVPKVPQGPKLLTTPHRDWEARQPLDEIGHRQQSKETEKIKPGVQKCSGMLKTVEGQLRSQTKFAEMGAGLMEKLKESVNKLDREMEGSSEPGRGERQPRAGNGQSRSRAKVEKVEAGMSEELKESVSALDREMERNTELQREVGQLMSLAKQKEASILQWTRTASLKSQEWIRASREAGVAFRPGLHIQGLESKPDLKMKFP